MDKKAVIKIAEKFATEINKHFDCESVFLFGSYAKGSFHKDSDIDIAIILKGYDNLLNIQLELMKLRRKIDSRIEPHPIRLNDFNKNNPIFNEIVSSGEKICIE